MALRCRAISLAPDSTLLTSSGSFRAMAKDCASGNDPAVAREQLLNDVRHGFEQLDQGKCATFDEAMLERIRGKGRQMLEAARSTPRKAP